jgi:hypothetical protein
MGNKDSSITKFKDEDISISMNKDFIVRLEKHDPEFWEYYQTKNKHHFFGMLV